jgi:hypothetical protein
MLFIPFSPRVRGACYQGLIMNGIRRTCRRLGEDLTQHPIKFVPCPLIDKKSKVLALGSCFALRVKEFLLANGYCVLNEGDLQPATTGNRPEFDPRIYYNTFCIRYEFERPTGQFVQEEDDLWEPYQNLNKLYQDPYRRMLTGTDRDGLWSRIREVDTAMRRHIEQADLVIVTLGLTEVFFQQHNDRAICAVPGYCGGGGLGCEFRCTEYQENYDNIEQAIRILQQVNPKAHMILTVSPVPLGSTFAIGTDHLLANTESKSVLRAVAGALVRKYSHVHYFHSYELVMSSSREAVYMEDGRHVQPSYVAGIMQDFERAFLKAPSGGAARLLATQSTGVKPHISPKQATAMPIAGKPAPVCSPTLATVKTSGPGPVLITVE